MHSQPFASGRHPLAGRRQELRREDFGGGRAGGEVRRSRHLRDGAPEARRIDRADAEAAALGMGHLNGEGGLQPQHLGATVSVGARSMTAASIPISGLLTTSRTPRLIARTSPDTALLSASSTRREAMTTLP